MPVNFGILQQMVAPKVVGEIQSQPEESGGGLGDLLSGLRALVGSPSAPSMVTAEQSPFNATYGSQYNAPSLQQEAIANTLGFRHGGRTDPTQLIFHDTAGPTFQSAANTLKERGLSYNYIIDKDGTIHNLVPPGTKAFHAKGYNDNTVGISFVGGGGYGQVTPAQQKASVALAMNLKKQFPALSGFAGHKDRSHAGKIDPEGFDYDSFASATGLPFMQTSPFQSSNSQRGNSVTTKPITQSSNLLKDIGLTTKTIAGFEGLEGFKNGYSNARWDVNAYRIGHGSDTITQADGTIVKVKPGMRITAEDAARDLQRRIPEFAGKAAKQIGINTWNSLTPQAQAALTSISYNYGSIPKRILPQIQSGDINKIREAILSLSGDNKGINSRRRKKEAEMLRSSMNNSPSNIIPPVQQPTPQEHKTYEDAVRALDSGRDSYASMPMSVIQPALPQTIHPQQTPTTGINWGLLKSIIERA